MSWRDELKIHPACNLVPELSNDEKLSLGNDIKNHGLVFPIVIFKEGPGRFELLDGRSRLDAMEMAGIDFTLTCNRGTGAWCLFVPTDGPKALAAHQTIKIVTPAEVPDLYAYVLSANLHRRHLTQEQKVETIAKILAAKPELSDRAIGRMVKADHKTVAKVRGSNGEFPHKDRTEAGGRKARGRKPTPTTKATKPKSEAKPDKPVRQADEPMAERLAQQKFDTVATTNFAKPEPGKITKGDILSAYVDMTPEEQGAVVMSLVAHAKDRAGVLDALAANAQFGPMLRAQFGLPDRDGAALN